MPERGQSLGSRGLHLFALCGFALAQPLLGLLSRHTPFLVAHDLSAAEIGLLVAVVVFTLPAALWLLGAAISVVSGPLSRAVHQLSVAILIAVTALPTLHRMQGVTGDVAVALSVGAGAFATVVYAGTSNLRRFLSFLALAPIVFAGAFLFDSSISKLLFEPRGSIPLEVEVQSDNPVVFLVFDELPLTSLLRSPNRIDRLRYPAFHRLAQGSTWYRNATTVHSNTVAAVPALLTGRYPEPDSLPTAADHPNNLFTLLASHYAMDVRESFTRIWQPLTPRGPGEFVNRMRAVGSDLGILYLHIVLPEDLSERLPRLSHGWKDFRDRPPARGPGDGFDYGKTPDQTFRRSIASIESGDRPGFWYVHVNFPHRPWYFVPSGRSYHPASDFGLRGNVWEGSDWWVTQAYQRHLLQLELADRLLGELLDRLESEGLYDDTLLVVVSDHGAGFWPGEARRDPGRMSHPEDVLSVPLFIKLPGQKKGEMDLRNAETVDVLPTIADALGVSLPWQVDGCSLLDESCPQRTGKLIFNKQGDRLEFPVDVMRRTDSLRRKIDRFGVGGRRFGLFRLGRYKALVGRRLEDLPAETDELSSILLDREAFTYAAARPDEMAVARIVGVLEGYTHRKNKAFVGAAANGIVGTVVPAIARADGRFFFSAMLPEEAQPALPEDLELFVVDGPPEAPRITAVRFSLGSLRDELAPVGE